MATQPNLKLYVCFMCPAESHRFSSPRPGKGRRKAVAIVSSRGGGGFVVEGETAAFLPSFVKESRVGWRFVIFWPAEARIQIPHDIETWIPSSWECDGLMV